MIRERKRHNPFLPATLREAEEALDALADDPPSLLELRLRGAIDEVRAIMGKPPLPKDSGVFRGVPDHSLIAMTASAEKQLEQAKKDKGLAEA